MVYIARYGEIGTKGKNRNFFEKKLVENIRLQLIKNKKTFEKIKRVRGRILVYSDDNLDILKYVFGMVSFSKAVETDLDIEGIKKIALKLYKGKIFRVTASRLEKKFLSSKEINQTIGGFIVKKKKAKVDLENPQQEIFIEIFNDKAYIFDQKIKCLGGLPVGVSGRVGIILENEDSMISAYLMMKRGCNVIFIKKNNIDLKDLEKVYPYRIEIFDKIPEDIEVIVSSVLKDYKDKIVFNPIYGYNEEKIKEIKKLLHEPHP
nr:hypothetical protein [Candidatus Woesearchaeota archaeon]